MRGIRYVAFTAVAVGLVAGLGKTLPAAEQEEVNLYSAREEVLIRPLLDQFTAQTGIKVNVVTGDADALLKRVETEGRNTPADVLLTADAGRLHRAKVAGALQPVASEVLEAAIPAPYREPEGYWYGLSVRARPIMYAKDRVDPGTLSTYEALAGPEWKGRICIRSSSNIYNQSLVASMIAHRGEAPTEAWARDFVKNFARPPKGGDRDQIQAVAAGECDVAVANTYYLGTMLHSADSPQREAAGKVAVFWPNQGDRGVHVNVSGAGITRFARHKDNALKLLEFMAGDDAQQWYAQANHEYPVKSGIAWSDTLKQWGEFKADTLDMSKLGEHNAAAVMLMDRAGWK